MFSHWNGKTYSGEAAAAPAILGGFRGVAEFLREVAEVVIHEWRNLRRVGHREGGHEGVDGITPETGVGVFGGELLRGGAVGIERGEERLAGGGVLGCEPLLGHQADVERIGIACGGDDFARLGGAAEVAERGGLEAGGADVERVGIERAVREISGRRRNRRGRPRFPRARNRPGAFHSWLQAAL
jgi:hypothetical protein